MRSSNLFKAKRTDNQEWIVGYLYRVSENHPPFIMLSDRYGESYEVDESTICRCVGIEDSTKNLLFEHDIIEKEFYTDWDAYANSEGYVGVLQWTEDLCSWDIRTSKGCRELSKELEFTDFKNHCKVVGNEFDNPELLEQFHIPSMREKVLEDKEEMEL